MGEFFGTKVKATAATRAVGMATALSADATVHDTMGGWVVANPTRITAKLSGYFRVRASCKVTEHGGVAVTGPYYLTLHKNGSGTPFATAVAPGTTSGAFPQVQETIYANKGDYFEAKVNPSSGGSSDVDALFDGQFGSFEAVLIGEAG